MNGIENYEELLKEIKKYITDEKELEIIEKAYEFASKAHEGVKRLRGEDYIIHPLNTAYILTTLNADAVTLAGALLHDVLKNENIKIEEVEEAFGKDIASIVSGVDRITKLDFEADNHTSINKQRQILVGLSEDVRVLMIKLAERLHNMRTLEYQTAEKQKKKAIETLQIYAPIAHGIGLSKIKSELEDTSLKYAKPEGYRSVIDKLDETKEERDKYVEAMIKEVNNLLDENGIKHEIKGRSKGIYSIYKKLDKGKRFEDIYDILALRVFVDTIPECYQVMGIIHSKYKPVPRRFKDFIAMPKANMYQSLHTTVYGIDNEMFEIQIRTYEMDEIAERGIASHWSYKNGGKPTENGLEQKLQFFRSIIELNKEEENDEDFVKTVQNEVFNSVIYVYTPNGKVIELPEGATPIDFAYRIHTDIGDKMVGAMVNGSIVPLDYTLHDNDVVKININKNQVGPSYEWLNIVKTNGAKSKIKSYFNKIDKEEYRKRGEESFKDELRKKKLVFNEILSDDNITKILKEFHFNNIDELYIGIGQSNITVGAIINFITGGSDSKEEKIIKKATDNEVVDPHVKNDIVVKGIDNIKVNIASCCRPIPGDELVGYITKGYGINVHKHDCNNIKNIEERIIEVRWNDLVNKKYPAKVEIKTLKNDSLLVEIIAKTNNNNINVQSINTKYNNDYTIYNLTILVNNKDILNKFMNDIKNISDVISIERA